MRKLTGIMGAAAMLAAVARADDFSAWPRRMMMTAAGYDGETLENFPVLARLGPEVTGEMEEDGADLRFADADGAGLPHEIDTWDTGGVSLVWVRMTELKPSSALFAYWGVDMAGNPPPPPDAAQVWSQDFTGVWHFNEPVNGGVLDSTATGLDGFRVGNVTTTSAGAVGGAQSFPGGANYIRVPDNRAMDLGGTFSISGWFQFPPSGDAGVNPTIFNRKWDWQYGEGWQAQIQDGVRINARGNDWGWQYVEFPEGVTLDAQPRPWIHATVQFRGPDLGSFYINGEHAGDSNLGGSTATDHEWPLDIGSSNGDWSWTGLIDEARLENAIRSPDWVKASYDTVASGGFLFQLGPRDNTAGLEPVAMLDAHATEHDTAVVMGALDATVFPQTAWLCWGAAPGGKSTNAWNGAASPLKVEILSNVFSATLSNLLENTTYYAQYALDNGAGGLLWSDAPVEFHTPGAGLPLLGGIVFKFMPQASTASVDIVQLGAVPSAAELALAWWPADSSSAEKAVTNAVPPAAGANTLAFDGLALGATYNWRATLTSGAGATAETNGTFTVAYTHTWTGGAYDGLWRTPGNWDIGIVPNHTGAVVRIESGGDIDLAGMGDAVVGRLEIELPASQWEAGARLVANDNARLLFNNNGAGALASLSGYSASFCFGLPLVLESPLRTRTESLVAYTTRFLLAAPLSGPAPLVLEKGDFHLFADAGKTVVIDHPIINGETGELCFLRKHGAGEVILQNGVYELNVSGPDMYGDHFITGGGTLTFSNTTFIHSNDYYDWWWYLFAYLGDGNTWRIADGAQYINATSPARAMQFAENYNNTVQITGPGSAMLGIPDFSLNGTGNTLRIEDGGLFSCRGGNFNIEWENNLLHLASETSGPAVLDLNGAALSCYHGPNTLHLGAGGVITNASIFSVTGNGNTLRLAGGSAHCGEFTFGADNMLAPVFGTPGAGAAPIQAATVTFNPGAKITPLNPGRVTGVFPLVQAANAFDITGLELVPPDNAMLYKLIPATGQSATLAIHCSVPGSLLLLR